MYIYKISRQNTLFKLQNAVIYIYQRLQAKKLPKFTTTTPPPAEKNNRLGVKLTEPCMIDRDHLSLFHFD